MSAPLAVVLMGPPGSGKTHLARALARTAGFHFHDAEKELVERYGSREAFVTDKPSALAALERDLRERLRTSAVPLVIEASGVSDGPMLVRLREDFVLRLVRVSAPRELCAERVLRRAPGANLANDPGSAARFHDFWLREVAPRWDFDLEVVNDGASDAAILRAIEALAGGFT